MQSVILPPDDHRCFTCSRYFYYEDRGIFLVVLRRFHLVLCQVFLELVKKTWGP